MKKTYRCKKIGTGTEEDPFRPKIADYHTMSIEVVEDHGDGTVSCVVDIDDQTMWAFDSDIVETF